ncbi:MAG TPA: hypothetical protein VKE96_30615 [Vicinamibacterales bacterium]|nr:hypothetical protein [Vicinamibacterales bacterium]
MMKSALTMMCVLVLMAVSYLSVSLIVLNPPRANVGGWFALAAFLAAQTILTLLALHVPGLPAPLRAVVVAGACVLVGIAVWRVQASLGGTHFEGYNLLLAAMLVVQAALTIIVEGRAALSHGALH